MRRREFLKGLFLVAAITIASPLHADPVADVTRQLQAQGFQVREVSRTWLGRIRIIAETDTIQREIVFDRTTGEIRRDLLTQKRPPRPGRNDDREDGGGGRSADGGDGRSGGGGGGGGGNAGGGGGQDDDDDDDDDDD